MGWAAKHASGVHVDFDLDPDLGCAGGSICHQRAGCDRSAVGYDAVPAALCVPADVTAAARVSAELGGLEYRPELCAHMGEGSAGIA